MVNRLKVVTDPLKDQLHGFTRSVTEIQWLTLVLVLLFLFISGIDSASRYPVIAALVTYGAFILVFSYSGFFKEDAEWKLAVETWGMILFITFVLWHTGDSAGILENLYLLAIISAALTLGKLMTMLEVALVAACFIFLGYDANQDVFSLAYTGGLLTELAPMILVAYLTTMLASDIHFAHEKIRRLAAKDELTGLMNLRGFNNILQREHEQAVRYARQYSVAMIDVNDMKAINDSYGHEVGNNALKLVAATLRASVRNTDAAARFGGDEFVLLLVESPLGTAAEVIARFRQQIDKARLQVNGDNLKLNVSIGIASYPANGSEPEDLLRTADLLMYEEKQQAKVGKPEPGSDVDPPSGRAPA